MYSIQNLYFLFVLQNKCMLMRKVLGTRRRTRVGRATPVYTKESEFSLVFLIPLSWTLANRRGKKCQRGTWIICREVDLGGGDHKPFKLPPG